MDTFSDPNSLAGLSTLDLDPTASQGELTAEWPALTWCWVGKLMRP